MSDIRQTNLHPYPWEIDECVLRRFQKRLYVPLPDRAVIERNLRDMADGELDVQEWAERLGGLIRTSVVADVHWTLHPSVCLVEELDFQIGTVVVIILIAIHIHIHIHMKSFSFDIRLKSLFQSKLFCFGKIMESEP
jgi:hypothetical protein